MPKITDIYTAH